MGNKTIPTVILFVFMYVHMHVVQSAKPSAEFLDGGSGCTTLRILHMRVRSLLGLGRQSGVHLTCFTPVAPVATFDRPVVLQVVAVLRWSRK